MKAARGAQAVTSVSEHGGARVRRMLEGDRAWSCGLFFASLALYVSTLCPTVYFYDSAELAAAAALLGIPHPPGYPLYTLLGHAYGWLVPGEPALAVNVMSAVHGALCVALAFWVQRRLGADRECAALGALLLGVGESFWWNSSVAEVYTTGLLFVLATFALLLEGCTRDKPSLLLWAAFVAGLGFAAHMFIATLGVGYALLVWTGSRALERGTASRKRRLRFMLQAGLTTLAGACLYLYIPLRASMHPSLDFAHAETAERFFWLVSGGEYKRWFLRDFGFGERTWLVASRIAQHLSVPGTLLGLAGIALMCVRSRAFGVALLLSLLGNVWFFFAYRVHDVEVFFLPAAVVLTLGIGPSLTAVRERWAARAVPAAFVRVGLALCFVGVVARVLLAYATVDMSQQYAAHHYGEEVASFLPRDSLVVSVQTPDEWKYRTVFEDYFQKTLGVRTDVVAVATGTQALFFEALATGRPMFMYARVPEIEALADVQPEGPMFRVRPRTRSAR